MGDCAVLSTNGEMRYYDTPTTNTDGLTTFNTSSNPSATSHPMELGSNNASIPSSAQAASSGGNVALTESQGVAPVQNEEFSVDSEVPLRRSKRGKGRGAASTSGQSNNGLVTDDRVSSCIVEGVEYKTGDFVYYEEPDFEYYTIGLIEEIKFSRRDKFSILVKCFYRTHDIPETSKQSVLEREHFHTPSNSKLMDDVLSRELFASEVQETLTSKQLRGRCHVSHLPNLRTAMVIFRPTEEDSFFYVFAYNPETRRLMNTRAEIRVGNAYQASIPPFRHHPPATYNPHVRRHKHTQLVNNSDFIGPSIKEDVCIEARNPKSSNHYHLISSDQPPAAEESRLPDVAFDVLRECNAETETDAKSPPKLELIRSGSPKSTSPSRTSSAPVPHSGCSHRFVHSHYHHRHHRSSRGSRSSHLRESLKHRLRRRRSTERITSGTLNRRFSRRHRKRRWETIVWKPQGLSKALSGPSAYLSNTDGTQSGGDLADEPLKTYLDAVRSMVAFFGFGGADDDLSSAENGLVLANLAATTQHAYDTLHSSDYSLTEALQKISFNPIVSKNTPRHWTADQVRLFAHALRLHGKDFHTIQREFFDGQNSASSANPNSTGTGTGNAGRTRGRGGGRRKTGANVAKSSVPKEEDEMKVDQCKEDAIVAGVDIGQNQSGATPISCEPVKTVKELIAFYYYWKRKGAAANSSACSSSVSSTGAGGGSMLGVAGALTQVSGSLASAAVNFSAAVAAAANADNQSVAIAAAQNASGATGSQAYGKKRKHTTRGNLSARASTPTSERSDSAAASLPDSEVEDTTDAAGVTEETQFMECHTDRDEDNTSSAKPAIDGLDVPPPSRLRRRLCRNCDKDLSSPGESSVPSGVGQLRYLCTACRVHLQKYGELRTNVTAPSAVEQPKKMLMDGSHDATEQHSPPHGRHTLVSGVPAQPFLSPSAWSPCSYMDTNPEVESNHSSPNSWASWYSYSTCSGSAWSPSVVSGSSPSGTTFNSSCPCTESASEWSSDTDSAVSGTSPNRHRHQNGMVRHSKRRRFQSQIDQNGNLPGKAAPLNTEVLDGISTNEVVSLQNALCHQKPVARDCASVPTMNIISNALSSNVPPRPGSTPAGKSVICADDCCKPTATIGTNCSVLKPVQTSDSHTISVKDLQISTQSCFIGAIGEPSENGDDDLDLMALLNAPPREPLPCFVEAHASLWSNLARIWDRSVHLSVQEPNERVLYDPGTCARTDLVYVGRRLATEDRARWLWEREQLYAKHTDTAIGPGAAKSEKPVSLSTSPTITTATRSPTHDYGPVVEKTTTLTTQSGISYEGNQTSHSLSGNNVALDLCARPSPSYSPPNCRTTSLSVHNLTASASRVRRGSATSGPSLRHTASHSPSSRVSSVQQPLNAFDPSHTHHHIQAAYEQAMLLAGVNPHYHSPQSHVPPQRSSTPLREPSKLNPPSTRSCPTSASSAKTTIHTVPPRLGAAAGTFYPPALISSASSAGHASAGLTSVSVADRLGPPQSLISGNSVSSIGCQQQQQQQHHQMSHPSSAHRSHASFAQPSGPPTSQTMPDVLFKHPEMLQRQLALLGFMPPEQAVLNALDPREVEALRRFMGEKWSQFRGPIPSTHGSTSHDGLLTHQQELLAAAAMAELVMRRGEHLPLSAHNPLNASNYLPIPNCGAMTSAVNTITTRPTASIQLSHSFRYPTGPQTPPVSHSVGPRSLPHPTPEPAIHIPQPPAAHHNPSPRIPTVGPTSIPLSTANYLSMLATGTGTQIISPRAPMAPSPGPSRSNGTAGPGPNTATAGPNTSHGTINAAAAANAQFQEQMLHAAKFAMLAANMQGDPNKATQFANLAAAAFAELAAVHEKSQGQSPSSFGSHASPAVRSLASGPTPSSISGAFDFRTVHPAAFLQPHLTDSFSPATVAVTSQSNMLPPPLLHAGDRRRSVPSAHSLPSSSISLSSHGGHLMPNPMASGAGSAHRITPRSTLPPGPTGRYNPAPNLSSVPQPQGTPPNIASPSQLAQFAQFAQQSAAAGFAQGFSLQDPAMLNALMLAATAAQAANPGSMESIGPFLPRESDLERQRFQQAAINARNPVPPHPQSLHSQQQSQQNVATAAAAAAAAFASAGFPPLNLGPRMPSSHP